MSEVDFDDKWLDLDFSKQPEFVFGCTGYGEENCSNYEDAVEVLSESQIREAVERETAEGGGSDRMVSRIFDQGREGACVSDACGQGNEVLQAYAFGIENVTHVSAISLYKRIGSSPSSGANVGHGVREMSTRGILPLDNAENKAKYGKMVMPNTGFYTKYPEGWEEVAKTLATVEYHTIKTVAGLRTAMVMGHPVIVGRQGHSVCYLRLMLKNGRYVYKYANSWGDWGDNGFGYDSESQGAMSARGCYALRSVKTRAA